MMLDTVPFSTKAAAILSKMRENTARINQGMTSTVQLTRESIRQSLELMQEADCLLASHSRWLNEL